jgi:hypothetical protein
VFFGTPHRGLDGNSWERVAGSLLSASGYNKQVGLVGILKQSSQALKAVCHDFQLISRIYKMVSIFEQGDGFRPVPVGLHVPFEF